MAEPRSSFRKVWSLARFEQNTNFDSCPQFRKLPGITVYILQQCCSVFFEYANEMQCSRLVSKSGPTCYVEDKAWRERESSRFNNFPFQFHKSGGEDMARCAYIIKTTQPFPTQLSSRSLLLPFQTELWD